MSVFGLTACSSDDHTATPEPQPTNQLVGKWDLQAMDMKLEMEGNVVFDEKDILTKDSGIIVQYDFKADNNVTYYMYTPATAQTEEREQQGTGTYQKNGNTLTITADGAPQTFQILLLEQNKLHLNLKQEDESTKINITQKFVKI
nr:lipocalin family protein [Flavobacterium sp. CBA20B-1]